MNICAVALVFLLDASSSVSEESWSLQKNATAAALEDERIVSIIENTPNGVAVKAVSFASRAHEITAWVDIKDPINRKAFVKMLRDAPSGGVGITTEIHHALQASISFFDSLPCAPDDKIIDISTDGVVPESQKKKIAEQVVFAQQQNIKINALGFPNFQNDEVVQDLEKFLFETVITPNGFFIVTQEWLDYSVAIRRKIIQEIALR